jgi:hypothetical protein
MEEVATLQQLQQLVLAKKNHTMHNNQIKKYISKTQK